MARSPRYSDHDEEELDSLEQKSFFDTNFDKLYNQLDKKKDSEVEKLVKKTKDMQRSKNVTSMPELPDLPDLTLVREMQAPFCNTPGAN